MSLTSYSSSLFCPLHLSQRLFSKVLYQHDKPYHRHNEGTMEDRLQSTWHTLQSEGFGHRSPFPFTVRFRKCCNPLRWKVAPKTWDMGRTSQDAFPQSHTTDRKWPLVLLHVQKCPPHSRPLRTLKLTRNAMCIIHRIENDGVGLWGLEIKCESKCTAVEDNTQNKLP